MVLFVATRIILIFDKNYDILFLVISKAGGEVNGKRD